MIRASATNKADLCPLHWDILSDDDKAEYRKLQRFIDPLSFRTTKDDLSVKFRILISHIQQYTTRNDHDDWKRQWVCGILCLDNAFAVSTQRLSMLVGKCKSSINCGFQSLGYESVSMSATVASALARTFPFFARDCREVRQWTVRAKQIHQPIQYVPRHYMTLMNTPQMVFTPQKQQQITQISDPLHSWTEISDDAFDLDRDGFGLDDEFVDIAISFP
jgi:hypothetical protein